MTRTRLQLASFLFVTLALACGEDSAPSDPTAGGTGESSGGTSGPPGQASAGTGSGTKGTASTEGTASAGPTTAASSGTTPGETSSDSSPTTSSSTGTSGTGTTGVPVPPDPGLPDADCPATSEWPSDVANFQAPPAGEHPRLLFRKSDLPALRARAETPEGKAIVARLKRTLGGGETLPTSYNPATAAYTTSAQDMPLGTYTIGHAAGFAMLWQITGDMKYADLARQCVEKGLAGQRDRDDRYSYVGAGGFLRAGPSLAALALAYDLGYDGWDAAFRERVRKFIHDYDGGRTDRDGGGQMTLERLATSPQLGSGSNHWLAQVGGAGLAVLAVRGDPGSDEATMSRYWTSIEANTVRGLTEGFGDYGYFEEQHGPSQIASDTGFMVFLQAAKGAQGRDFLCGKKNGRALALRWIHLLMLGSDGRPYYPNRHPSDYGTMWYGRGDEPTHQLSHSGAFAQGFGIVSPAQRAALLWTYENVVEPSETKSHSRFLSQGERSFDAIMYPHWAVAALVNWPIGVPAKNPAEVLPHVTRDSIKRYYVMRGAWSEAGTDDLQVSVLAGARAQKKYGGGEPILVWGRGKRLLFHNTPRSAETHFAAGLDGSATISIAPTALAVDFSGASGADLLVVVVNPDRYQDEQPVIGTGLDKVGVRDDGMAVTAGSVTYHVLTVGGAPASPQAMGDDLKVGGQTVSFDGQKLTLSVFSE